MQWAPFSTFGYWCTTKQLNSHWNMDGERKLCRQNNNARKRDCDRTTLNGSNVKKLWQRRRIETMQQLAYAGRESASYEVCIYWNGMAETDLKSVNFFSSRCHSCHSVDSISKWNTLWTFFKNRTMLKSPTQQTKLWNPGTEKKIEINLIVRYCINNEYGFTVCCDAKDGGENGLSSFFEFSWKVRLLF